MTSHRDSMTSSPDDAVTSLNLNETTMADGMAADRKSSRALLEGCIITVVVLGAACVVAAVLYVYLYMIRDRHVTVRPRAESRRSTIGAGIHDQPMHAHVPGQASERSTHVLRFHR